MRFKQSLNIIKLIPLILISPIEGVANEKPSTNTIPFATYELAKQGKSCDFSPNTSDNISCCLPIKVQKVKPTDIPTDDIAKLAKQVRNAICKEINPGSVEVWIGIGADENALVVNSHIDGGIKVIFECTQQSSK